MFSLQSGKILCCISSAAGYVTHNKTRKWILYICQRRKQIIT